MYLVTGIAGFIGFHTAQALLAKGIPVIGLDNLCDYYDVGLKNARLEALKRAYPQLIFQQCNIADPKLVSKFSEYKKNITHIIHLAAQPGVRHSLKEPFAYIESNITGQLAMLELSRQLPSLQHFIYASSSSVYGGSTKPPFKVSADTDHPVSLYAASKKSAELIAESYAHLYHIPITGLRFFTVYGPWGRPDMAYFSFTRKILSGQAIPLFNQGKMLRDFTYISDIIAGIISAANKPPVKHSIYNLGGGHAYPLEELVSGLEKVLGKKAVRENLPMQPGDIQDICADISASERDLDYRPKVGLTEGLQQFVQWYKDFYAQ